MNSSGLSATPPTTSPATDSSRYSPARATNPAPQRDLAHLRLELRELDKEGAAATFSR